MPAAHFTEPTTSYWQTLLAPGAVARPDPPWQFAYPAVLPDGRVLKLPIRALAATPDHAVASLLLNQASLAVVDTLGEMLAASVTGLSATRVVGLPTLGLTLASVVARELGHARYLPMGYSRKFWYDEALAAPVRSITTPDAVKHVYLDPHLLPLVRGQRVVLVDDAISSGSTAPPVWDLVESLGARVLAYGVAMKQGRRWQAALGAERAARVIGVFDSPLLRAVPDGWVEAEG